MVTDPGWADRSPLSYYELNPDRSGTVKSFLKNATAYRIWNHRGHGEILCVFKKEDQKARTSRGGK
jgi:hypothetical protein